MVKDNSDKYKNLMLDLFDGHRPSKPKTIQVTEYRDNDPRMLAYQIKRIFDDKELAIKLSKNAIKKEVFKFIELVKTEQLKDNFPINWRIG